MRVKLLKCWNGYKAGKVFDEMPAGAGRLLVRRGYALEVMEGGKPPALKARRKPCEANSS